MCNNGSSWKRQVVPDHKFDFIDTREFTDNGCAMRSKYMWLYSVVLKDFLVYVSDIFTAITMLSTQQWSNQVYNSCKSPTDCISIPYNVGKWLFVGCIIFSFLLLAYEAYKAKKIIVSRDISYAFTNPMANNYYSLRSYDHFCFFEHISDSTKTVDDFAFFVFFTFKSWKRLLLADGPRQSINALTLFSFYKARETQGAWYDIAKYFQGNSLITCALTVSMFFTVIIFLGSLLLLIAAGLCYVPLLCHIQGNLKEYCCHKVDKVFVFNFAVAVMTLTSFMQRITEILARRTKQRMLRAAELTKKEAGGDFSHLKNSRGEVSAQPTLPNLSVDDDFNDASSMRTRGPPPSTLTGMSDYYSDYKGDYPPMPAYDLPYSKHQVPGGYATYNPSVDNIYDGGNYIHDDETGSTANLALGAVPFSSGHEAQNSTSYGHIGNPSEMYYGHNTPSPLDRAPSRSPVKQQEAYLPFQTQQHDPYRNQYETQPYGYDNQYAHEYYQRSASRGPRNDTDQGYTGQAL